MNATIPEPLFREFMRLMPICTVDVLPFNAAGDVLLFRRTTPPLAGEWFTAGGRLLKDEPVREGAVRCLFAETGICVAPERLFLGGVFDEIHDESRFGAEPTYHAVNICWGCILDPPPQVALDPQHDACAWLPPSGGPFHPLLERKLRALESAFHAQRPRHSA